MFKHITCNYHSNLFKEEEGSIIEAVDFSILTTEEEEDIIVKDIIIKEADKKGINQNVKYVENMATLFVFANCYHRYVPKYQGDSSPQNNNNQTAAQNSVMITEFGDFDEPSTSMLAVPETLYDHSSYPDSGATNHVTPDSSNLMTKAPYNGESMVKVANGSSTNIRHIGKSFFFTSKNSVSPLFLSNLLHVPHFSKNLRSVSQFA